MRQLLNETVNSFKAHQPTSHDDKGGVVTRMWALASTIGGVIVRTEKERNVPVRSKLMVLQALEASGNEGDVNGGEEGLDALLLPIRCGFELESPGHIAVMTREDLVKTVGAISPLGDPAVAVGNAIVLRLGTRRGSHQRQGDLDIFCRSASAGVKDVAGDGRTWWCHNDQQGNWSLKMSMAGGFDCRNCGPIQKLPDKRTRVGTKLA